MSYLVLLFQNESSCTTFRMKVRLIDLKMSMDVGGTHFHNNGFSRGLV